jgi:hypothetical protein
MTHIRSHSLGYPPEGTVGSVCPHRRSLLVRGCVYVHPGGVQALVAQDVLDLAGIGAVLGEASGRRMAKGMHQRSFRYPGADAGPAVGLAHRALRSSPPEALAAGVDEQGRGWGELPIREVRLAGRQVVVDDDLERAFDRSAACSKSC